MDIPRFIGTRIAAATPVLLLAAQAYAVTEEVEAPPSVGFVGKMVFAVLFFGFCGGIVWMMARQKNDEDEKGKKE